MQSTDIAWSKWGRHDPYYGVLSVTEYRRESLTFHLAAFFASGAEFIEQRLAEAERLYGRLQTETALDFGCGVGRLVIPLAKRFDRVTGVDVSDAMLDECRANLERRGLDAELVKSDDALSRVSGPFDFVNSYIVLQHIPVARGMALIERLLALTASGGVVSLQFTTDRGDNPLQAVTYWVQRRVPGVHALVNLLRGRRFSDPLVQMNEYDLVAVKALFADFSEITVTPDQQGRVKSVNVMARKHQNINSAA